MSEKYTELLRQWRRTGFAVPNSVTVWPSDTAGVERVAHYLLRSPISLERVAFSPGDGKVCYQPKPRTRLGEN